MAKLFFNAENGVLGIAEENEKGQLIRSSATREKEVGGMQDIIVTGMSNLVKYIGSDFYEDVQGFLARQVDQKQGFRKKQRSRYNQQAFREALVGVYGVGKTFGDIDAYKNRNYMYTLRARTRCVRFWEMDAEKFILHVKCFGRERAFNLWQQQQEEDMIN